MRNYTSKLRAVRQFVPDFDFYFAFAIAAAFLIIVYTVQR